MSAIMRLAWRETRATPGRYLFFVLSVAVGVAALVGVRGFGASLQVEILRAARQLMAADMQAATSKPPTPEDRQALASLGRLGVEATEVAELLTLAAVPGRPDTALVELKAYEPGRYPFYGRLEADPPAEQLPDDGVLVAPDLLDRLGLQPGDALKLGKATFRIHGVVRKEPDRVATGFSLGPRVLITRQGLARAELVVPGSRVRHTFLLKLPASVSPAQVKAALAPALDRDWSVRDYREAQPRVTRTIDRMARFLSLVALLALAAGGLGVAHTCRAFLQQKLDTIAILKCLGASSRTVLGIYLAQALGLGLLGSLLGAAAGYGVQAALPRLIGPLLALDVAFRPAVAPALPGGLIGTGIAGLFALAPLLAVGRVPPALVFRRDMLEEGSAGGRLRRAELAAAGAAAAGLGLAAAWQARSWLWGLYFLGALGGAAALLGAAAWLALRLVRRAPAPRRVALRHGLLNLNRPGSQAGAVVVALGLGVTAVATVYLLQGGLLAQVTGSSPAGAPNLVLLGIQPDQAEALTAFLQEHPAVLQVQELTPLVPARLLQVDGRGPDAPAAGAPATGESGAAGGGSGGAGRGGADGGDRWYWNRQWTVTWAAALPEKNELVAGRWWTAADARAGAYISLEEEAARRLGARVGSEMVFEVDGRPVRATVMSLRRVDWARISANFLVIFSPGALDGASASYTAFARTDRSRQAPLLRALVDRFPAVTAVDIGEVLATLQSVLDRVGLVVRFVAAFAMAAGLVILAGGVAATRFRRVREAAILRTLGASRRTVAAAMAVEYAVLGLVAGLTGALLAHLAAGGVMRFILELDPVLDWGLLALAPALCAALTVATGALAAWDLLTLKPLPILRGE